MRGYDRDELHGGIEDYDEYEEEGEELEDDSGEGQGEEEGYEEEEQEDPKPTKEELDYLSLRQRLKEQIRKQMKKENGSSLNSSNEKKKKLPHDNYGSFFGPSQPVIAQRVIQESKSLLEIQHLPSRLPNSLHGNKKNSSTSKESRPGSRDQLPKVRSELKNKVQKLKDTRDYSFLLSEDAELPAPAKEPRPRNASFPNSEAGSTQVPLKSKKPLGNSGRHLHGMHGERKTVSVNGQSYSKTGSNKLTSANRPNSTSVETRKQLASNMGNGPGRPIGPKGLPLKKPVATMEKKALAPGAKNSIPGVQKPLTSKLKSSIPMQRLEQKRGLEEPKKAKMMPKQPMASSKPQINKPHKQVSSRPTSQDHRLKKKPPARYSDDEDGEKAISMIRQMFRYNPNRYDDYGDDSDMEANFEDIMAEEKRSAKIARKEDEEQLRLIEEEEERERLRKLKKRKLGR
ncbi:protein spt2-like isoform X2 [Corylus avellana]|uniref:protein spt2-like isoform X2 n=1 Tax=Corylus avellana TaxID=13451 RepID=UPI001E212F3F|nr:protein spt2-like isoform X2 [Corylus avellana]